jgi:hypothetical protein
VETADAGRGVRGRYSTDDLVPDVAAGPYLFLEPEHAYVLDSGGRAVGYVIGTASTPDFVAAYRERWLPRLRARYQPLSGPPVTEEEHLLDVMFHPDRWLLPELAPHPAHLHINLAAGYRGGWPRARADQHVPGLGGGRRGGVMLPRRPPGECARQALLHEARLAPGRGPWRGARDLPRPPDRLARTSPGHHRARQPRDPALAGPPRGSGPGNRGTISPGTTAHGRVLRQLHEPGRLREQPPR